ncbi:MAG: hypothetical protein IJL54_14280 [Prevotella sp.]|nr:hypothetical protein [Prevotella sp.]
MKKLLLIILAFAFTMTSNAQRSRTWSSSQMNNRPWSVEISTGYQFYTKGGSGVYAVYLGAQKQLSKHFSLGFTTGSQFPKGGDPIIPVFADFRGICPINDSKIDIIGIVRGGLYVNTNKPSWKDFGFDILPGVQYHATDKLVFLINSGFSKTFFTGDGYDFDMIPILVGVSFKL